MKSNARLGLTIAIPVLIILIVGGIYLAQQRGSAASPTSQTQSKQPLTTVNLALDWTPNTNHTGLYVAQSKKWYEQEGINLNILPYSSNVTPDVLVSSGKADIGVSSTESIVADAAAGQPVVSIAAILQHNTTSLAVLADSGINSPRDLDGKTYGAFGAPYESAVVSQIIKKAGGTGTFKSVILNVDTLQALKAHSIDFAWIFDGAEGIYTPTLIASPKEIKSSPDLLSRFMKATAEGYEYARTHAAESAQILIATTPKGTFADTKYVQDSQQYLSPRYADSGRKWGLQDAAAWQGYPQFILDKGGVQDAQGKVVKSLDLNALYTNQFLP
jgi:ABC-type nitrate/sulfonate/bicarbonate transport system substrate-binding protein